MDLALLTYRVTPLNHHLPSPAELLNSRRFKTQLPTRVVPTQTQVKQRQIMESNKTTVATQHNKSCHKLPELQIGQQVHVQLDPRKTLWSPGAILSCPTQERNSYVVKTLQGGIYTRNRRFIKPTSCQPGRPPDNPELHNSRQRSQRATRKPNRLIETMT